AILTAGGRGFALPGQADAVAIVHACGDIDRQGSLVFDAALSTTTLARLFDLLAGTATVGARLLDRKNPVLHAYTTDAGARRTGDGVAIFRTGALAFVARHQGRNIDIAGDAEHRFLEVDFQDVAQVRATLHARATSTTEDIAEDVAENIAHVAETGATAAAHATFERSMAVLVVHGTLLRIRQDVVGFLGFLETLQSFRIIRTAV